jgi:hypothetical protein
MKRVLKWFWFHLKRGITPPEYGSPVKEYAKQIWSFAIIVWIPYLLLVVFTVIWLACEALLNLVME